MGSQGQRVGRERGHQVCPGSFPAGPRPGGGCVPPQDTTGPTGQLSLQSHPQIQLPLVHVRPLAPPGIRVVKALCYF